MYWINSDIGISSVNEVGLGYPAEIQIILALDLVDGKEIPFRIYLKLKEALVYLAHGKKILFVCQAGISRSNGLATTLIAYLNKIDWDDAYNIIRKKVTRTQVNLDFMDSCKEALQIMRERLKKNCPYCRVPIENWESACPICWNLIKDKE